VLDLSPAQLSRDRAVAQREGLTIKTVEGDMQDLRVFVDASFDVVVHPVSNQYVPDIRAVWSEASRVLRMDGILISGFVNPVDYCLDRTLYTAGLLQLRYKLPYSDLSSLTNQETEELVRRYAPIEFEHTFEEQLGGQIAAGFAIIGFFEDVREHDLLNRCLPTYFATRAIKCQHFGRR
jgi:ubiquinone/menaquinone biosynthesis C-methylase UbiE